MSKKLAGGLRVVRTVSGRTIHVHHSIAKLTAFVDSSC